MPQQRKVYRIEEHLLAGAYPATPAGHGDELAALRHRELMCELADLRRLIDAQRSGRGREGVAERALHDAREIKTELERVHEAIRQTKHQAGGFEDATPNAQDMSRLARELDAVISATEQATQRILAAAEDIDQVANTLASLLKDGYALGLVQDLRDSVVRIFEACNFQDLTGQRIGNALATLKTIEDRIARLRKIWSRIEEETPPRPAAAKMSALPEQDAGRALLNGPKLPGEAGHSSQAEIDRMFDGN